MITNRSGVDAPVRQPDDISLAYNHDVWEVKLHPEVEAWFLELCETDPMSADLVAGDKSGQWQSWYRRAIPLADVRFEEHLTNLKEEHHE